MSLDDARDSESPLSVSDCREEVSTLSDEDGVSSLGGFTGLEFLEVLRGDDVTLYFRKGSTFGWNKESGLVLFGELSCKLAFLWSGVGFRKFG